MEEITKPVEPIVDETTTIAIKRSTKEELEKFRRHKGEPMDEIVRTILFLAKEIEP